MAKPSALQRWSVEDSAELYGIRNWSAGYFDVSSAGDVVICPFGKAKPVQVSIPDIIKGLRDRGLDMPVLLRIENILEMVSQGMGISLLMETPTRYVTQDAVMIPLMENVVSHISLVRLRRKHSSISAETFWQFVRKTSMQ